MAPMAAMLTTTSTEPRSGRLLESLATTVMVLSPTRAGSGVPVTPTCQIPTRYIGTFIGRGPRCWQPVIASVAATASTPAHLPVVFLRVPLMAASPSGARWEARRVRDPNRHAPRAAWQRIGPLPAALGGNPLGWPHSSLAKP